MGFLRRIGQWFSNSEKSEQLSGTALLRQLLDKARRAQYDEDYDTALEFLSQAMDIAEKEHDTRSKVDITLSRADILIAKADYETADFILRELREDSEARHLNAPLAYALCSSGVLEKSRGDLNAAQALFEEAREKADAIKTDGASGRAAAHLGDVYLARGNASYAVYLLEDAVVKLNRSGDRELLGYFLGQLGLAQIQSGHSEQGEVRLQRGLDLAMNIQHQAQMRYLNNLLGQQALKRANYPRARSFFENTLQLYPDPPPESADYARLLCNLSMANLRSGQGKSAEQFAIRALAIAESLADKQLIAMAKATMGLAMRSDDNEPILQYLEDAVLAYEGVEVDSFYIDILRQLASAQIKSGDSEKGIASYQEAIEKAEDLPGEAAYSYAAIANHYAKQGDLRKAIEQWQEALKYFQDANLSASVVQTHCDIASIYDRLGDGKMAQREFGTALEMLSRIEDTRTRGIILARIANAYSNYGDVESAQDFFKESIKIAEGSHDKDEVSGRQGDYGRLLALTNRPEQALTILMQAQNESEGSGLQAVSILANIGLANAMMKDYEAASEHFKQALSEVNKLDAAQEEARIYVNQADAALNTGDLSQATQYYDKAYALAQDNALVDVLVQATIGQALLAIQDDDLASAEKKLSDIDSITNRLDYRRLLATLNQAKSQLYAKQGKHDEATLAWEEAQKLRTIMRMAEIEPDWLS